MRKQELIHLHGLLAQIENHYETTTGDDVEHVNYGSVDVRPTSIHQSKDQHNEAVLSLVNDLALELGEEEAKTAAISAD